MVPEAVTSVKVMLHAALLDSQVVLTKGLGLYDTGHSVCYLDPKLTNVLDFAWIVCLHT